MNNIFKTFRPENLLIAKYVDYYYLDIKPANVKTEFDCFPHFNNTISLYKSHSRSKEGAAVFEKNAQALQIFTPIREKILQVKQIGEVHRVVIIFNPLGIQQFYKNLNFADFITDFKFFSDFELYKIFETQETTLITNLLDQFLFSRYIAYENSTLNSAIRLILDNSETPTVEEMATGLQISRRHLNRLFNTHLGVSVKRFNEIVLFRKVLEQKLFENTEHNFTTLAHDFNYFDQSHLNKVFRNFTSNSPKRFFKQGTLLGHEDIFWHFKRDS